MVSRTWSRPDKHQLWPIGLRSPLPDVPIPLKEGEVEIRLSLQGLIDRLYDASGYDKFIYDDDPVPPLAPKDAKWAWQFLRARR